VTVPRTKGKDSTQEVRETLAHTPVRPITGSSGFLEKRGYMCITPPMTAPEAKMGGPAQPQDCCRIRRRMNHS